MIWHNKAQHYRRTTWRLSKVGVYMHVGLRSLKLYRICMWQEVSDGRKLINLLESTVVLPWTRWNFNNDLCPSLLQPNSTRKLNIQSRVWCQGYDMNIQMFIFTHKPYWVEVMGNEIVLLYFNGIFYIIFKLLLDELLITCSWILHQCMLLLRYSSQVTQLVVTNFVTSSISV
jgi:hypothetical protein